MGNICAIFVVKLMIHNHGITLVPLSNSNLELLRCWRNSDFVKQYMQFQGNITESQQIKWFEELDERLVRYFLIKESDCLVGCCNIKNIDSDKGTAEGGVFVSEEKYLGTLIPIKAIFTLYDWFFSNTTVRIIKAEIVKTNKRAIRFNKGVGFVVHSEDDNLVYAKLTCDDFYSQYTKYKKVLDN
jgi:UDP-4-amino-4,6-dideoxy-N-acetyl-beta-L-altrosamine N-acetyltransferase